jgi:hypothetical protein
MAPFHPPFSHFADIGTLGAATARNVQQEPWTKVKAPSLQMYKDYAFVGAYLPLLRTILSVEKATFVHRKTILKPLHRRNLYIAHTKANTFISVA